MASVVLVLLWLWLCWALGPAAASAPPNILLLLMDDVSGAGGPPLGEGGACYWGGDRVWSHMEEVTLWGGVDTEGGR